MTLGQHEKANSGCEPFGTCVKFCVPIAQLFLRDTHTPSVFRRAAQGRDTMSFVKSHGVGDSYFPR